MTTSKQLEAQIHLLDPTFDFTLWAPFDSALVDRIEAVGASGGWSDHEMRYLAEDILLDSFKPERVADGIKGYAQRFVTNYCGGDTARRDAIDRLCRAASAPSGYDTAQVFFDLLSRARERRTHNHVQNTPTLASLKEVTGLTRVGDVVMLPEQADVVVIGDTHGDLSSTRQIIHALKRERFIERGGFVVFLGDYVHNGIKSRQNLYEILMLQQSHPESIVLLSGNHEFSESYLTALNETLNVHWQHFRPEELPAELQDRLPENDNHYAHLRLDLARDFGFAEGERLYAAFADWGMRLPAICISGKLMISHSLGALPGVPLTLSEFLRVKQQDVGNLRLLGFENWNARRSSLHSALVNTRDITHDITQEYKQVLDVDTFVVGHCHYRSGDTIQLGANSVTTVISSAPYSPDSGHYMYHQMIVTRELQREREQLADGNAVACFLLFTRQGNDTSRMERIAIE